MNLSGGVGLSYYARKIMCKKLNEISGLNAKEIALLCNIKSYPVNIQNILKKLRIPYGSMDFSTIEKKFPELIEQHGEILGAVAVIGNDLKIFYRKGSTENRIRFTLAHELAHCCLDAESLQDKGHIEFRFDESSINFKEKAANVFAGQLLIPDDDILKLYNELVIPASDVLANEFKVSTSVMEARLKYLGLDFYSPQYNNEVVGDL